MFVALLYTMYMSGAEWKWSVFSWMSTVFFKVVAYVFSLVLGLFGAGFLSPVSVE